MASPTRAREGTTHSNSITSIQQVPIVIPNVSMKELRSAIPPHCFKRSVIRSMSYVIWDLSMIAIFYKMAITVNAFLASYIHFSPYLSMAQFVVWAFYAFLAGLVMTGLWVVAHECGHDAFSEYRSLNTAVGWVLHSSLGVPYNAFRVTHAMHHASNGHMTQDQVFVPKTRSQLGLPPFDSTREDLTGSHIADEVMEVLWDALGDSPIGAMLGVAGYLLAGWLMYLLTNASGQERYPSGTNHFKPNSALFAPRLYGEVVKSDVGILLWLGVLIASIASYGFVVVFRTYIIPYLWLNHWVILISFLQHTDPVVPHYRGGQYNFPRGALSTLDRNLLGDCGKFLGWLGAYTTHGISETHVVHHLCSKIPHYHAWEATQALRKRLAEAGIHLEGRPGGWIEAYRVFKECKFVEDIGDIVFYKNAYGLATTRPLLTSAPAQNTAANTTA